MESSAIVATAKALVPLAGAISRKAAQLHAERTAAKEPFRLETDLLDKRLRETLGRFQGGSVDDGWWRHVLAELGQAYVAPEFFTKPAVREWLDETDVQDGIVSLARAKVMGQSSESESEIKGCLAALYSAHTGEADHFAEVPIDVAVAALTAGYMTSIPENQQPVAGMIQTLSGQVREIDMKLDQRSAPDAVVQSTHGKVAEDALSAILTLRMFDFNEATERMSDLWQRVNGGDLAAVPAPLKTRVRYWVARLLTSRSEKTNEVRSMRQVLSAHNMGENLYVLDALIKAASGDIDAAFRILKDQNDADSRSVLLNLLRRSKGEEEALEWFADVQPESSPEYFTSMGWREWAICLGMVGEWGQAADGLREVSSKSDPSPGITMIEGVINAALLIPEEHRRLVFEGVPTYSRMGPNLGDQARARHRRARECFDHVFQHVSGIASKSLTEFLSDWCTWVGLMDPVTSRADVARRKVRERLERGDVHPGLVAIAWTFEIQFDKEKLRTRLKRSERLGGLSDDEYLAECLLNQRSMNAREFGNYLDGRIERLDRVMSKSVTTGMLFQVLIEDGQVERARKMVERRRNEVDEVLVERMEAALAVQATNDPRQRLEAMYRDTDELVDLKNLIGHVMTVGDREALRPLLRTLFDREPKMENAIEVVRWLSHPPADHAAVVQFLEAYPVITQESDQLKSAMAWGLFALGRLEESRTINNGLRGSRRSRDDLALDLNISVAMGDWERLPSIIDREWPRRNELDAEMLMMLAHLASQVGQSPERPIALARLATEQAPDNPHILVAAYAIHFQLGRDAEANPAWLTEAFAHSSAEAGPIWQTDLKQMVNHWLPQARERNEKIDRMLMGGEMPLALAGAASNTPLSHILLAGDPVNWDGRRRVLVPIISGVRNRIDLEEGWTVGLDLTSIMVLARIGLLETALTEIDHVKLGPDAMACLFADRTAVRFHQPSRVDSAREIRRLIDRQQIKLVDRSILPSADLETEVGMELATLMEVCATEAGVLTCTKPIHKSQSLMEEVADTTAYDEFILSPADLCLLAHRTGLTDTDQNERAEVFMASQGQTSGTDLPGLALSGPIFIDSLALSYLQSAQVLGAICNGSIDVRVHHSVADEMHALIDAGDSGDELAEAVEGIRDTLRAGMESGKVTFLPQVPEAGQDPRALASTNSLAGLLHGSAEYDALCVDDRLVNAHARSAGPTGPSVPVLCVLDVLRYLHARRVISEERYWGARHRLRQAGFAFIPVEAAELSRHLLAVDFDDGRMQESAELRVIRQTVNRIDTLNCLRMIEARALGDGMVMACRDVIHRLWSDPTLDSRIAGVLSDWVWHHLGMATFLLQQSSEEDSAAEFRDGVIRRIRLLMLPPVVESIDRISEYQLWLERTVHAGLRSANDDMIEEAANGIREMIKAVGDDRTSIVAALFLKCLPESLRYRIVDADPLFAKDCGFTSKSVVIIGETLSVAEAELLEAAKIVFAGNEINPLADITGTRVELSHSDDDETLKVSWTDPEGTTCQVQVPELTLVSGDAKARIRVLNGIAQQLGPTAHEIHALREAAKSRPLSLEQASAVFGALTTGVASVQSRLAAKISQRSNTSVMDFVPPNKSYWERFSGPVPHDLDCDTYLRERLIPYRRELIACDLRAGLEIACLGALRDDLNPGAWVNEVEDDTIWDTLTSIHTRGNPIALLAILDIALYRAEDERFRGLADHTIKILLDDHLGLPPDCDIYKMFEILIDLEMDHLSLVDGASRCPGFWRRMCAWMQAGLVVRTALSSGIVPKVESLEEWCKGRMVPAGRLRRLADCRDEPLVLGHMHIAGSLRNEALERLSSLKERHQQAGRVVPNAAEIEAALSRKRGDISKLASVVPGPLAMRLRPDEPMPDSVADSLAQAWAEEEPALALAGTAHLSQFFPLRDDELAKVRESVDGITEELARDENLDHKVAQLHTASIVAAAARDQVLSDKIASAMRKFAGSISRPEEVEHILHILFRVAASHPEERAWGEWLAIQLAEVASQLPTEAGDCIKWLWNLLDSMGVVLPVSSWFHLRAKRIVGMALETAS